MPRRILLTGGAGYIGSQLLRELAADPAFEGATVRVFDNMQRGVYHGLTELPPGCAYEFHEGDVLDPAAMRRACAGVDVVVHLAAVVQTPFSFDHPKETVHVNHWGTVRLLDECVQAGCERFIFAGSTSVYGPGGLFDERSQCRPVGPYSQAKLSAEVAVHAAAERGLNMTILRFGTVFGLSPAARFDALPNRLAYLAATGRSIPVHGPGDQLRPLVHVVDACSAVRLCLLNPQATAGGCFNVVGENVSARRVAEEVAAVRPDCQVILTDQDVLTQFSLSVSADRLRALGWSPAHRLRDGVTEIVRRFGPFQPLPH